MKEFAHLHTIADKILYSIAFSTWWHTQAMFSSLLINKKIKKKKNSVD